MKKLFNLALLLLILNACGNVKEDHTLKNVLNTLDSLQKSFIPDTRVELWKVTNSVEKGQISIQVELENKTAERAILSTFKRDYPKVKINTAILPSSNSENTNNVLVNSSVSSIRAKYTHRSELINQVLLGTPLKIYKQHENWYLVQTPNKYIGWINAADIVEKGKTEMQAYYKAKKMIFKEQYGFSYSQPDDNTQVITDLAIGDILEITGESKQFYKIIYPDLREAYVKKAECTEIEAVFSKKPLESALVQTALKFNGIPYLWGGSSSKAIDCSGFTSLIYLMNGIVLQRDASQQIKYGKIITNKYESKDLKPGDLLFFGRNVNDSLKMKVTHVGMYIGNTEFIHASGKVKINSMDTTKNNYIADYSNRFIKAIRIIGNIDNDGIEEITHNSFYKKLIQTNNANK